MPGEITAIYAAILTLIYVVLSFRALLRRKKVRVGVGDGGDQLLIKATRAHANFAEYVPLALLLVYFLETTAGSIYWVHLCGIFLVVGRMLHAYGVSQVAENYRFRTVGMVCTLTILIVVSIRLLYVAVLT